MVGPDEMIIQLDEGLLDFSFWHPDQPSHQNHKREKHFGHNSSQFMGEENILPSEDGKDEEKSSWKHKKYQTRKDEGEEERKRGMNILQPHDRDVPKKKDETEEDQTGKNQKPDEDSLPGLNIQKSSRRMNVKFQNAKFK